MFAKTPLYDDHIKLKAKMVGFHGWDMPIAYGSQIEEHHYYEKFIIQDKPVVLLGIAFKRQPHNFSIEYVEKQIK